MNRWRALQLADSAFPAGGFAHSSGLEAAHAQGQVKNAEDLARFLQAALWQAGYSALPLAGDAHREPGRLAALDSLADVFLSNPVANRASRVQGRAFFSTCARSFDGVAKLQERARTAGVRFHFAPVFGAALRALELERPRMQGGLYLYNSLRAGVSAAIRLGIIGPYHGQRLQDAFAPVLDAVLSECGELESADLAQTSPLLDLLQANHDRLYSRLFQS